MLPCHLRRAIEDEVRSRQVMQQFTMNQISITVIPQCNERCIFCNIPDAFARHPSAVPSLKTLRKFLCNVPPNTNVFLTGGEPTLHPNLENLVRLSKRAGAEQVAIQTNGVLCSDRSRVARLREAGLTGALVSLHSHLPSISDHPAPFPGSPRFCHFPDFRRC